VGLGNNLEFYFQAWSFDDAKSQPTLGYRWNNIMNVTDTLKGRYMMYTIAFDCITSEQV
jgi:hypothetical protein